MFIHLATHSSYSLQEGLLSPTELVQAAQAQGMSALGLTDHRLLTGAAEFVHACKEAGIQPILGLEIDLEYGKLALLATSVEGWSNLCRLSSALAQIKDVFGDRLYLTLQDPSAGLPLSSLSRRMNVPMVVTHPVYYLALDQAKLQRTLAAIRLNQPLDQLPPDEIAPQGAYFTSKAEMARRFSGFQSELERTQEIAERCQFDLPLGVTNMPKVPLKEGMTPTQFLRQKAEAGAKQLYGKIIPEIQTRLDHELDTIARMGYEPIFLIVEDVLNYARQTGVPYSSRGSAASSLVAHCLGITSPDPLRLNLYFERFLNPARLTPPDIDTDLCSRRRDRVIQHVFDTEFT